MKHLLLLALVLSGLAASAQIQQEFIRKDTVTIMPPTGHVNAELRVLNATRDSIGGLFMNAGRGLGKWVKPRRSGDTLFLGIDTFFTSASIRAGRGITIFNDSANLGGPVNDYVGLVVRNTYAASKPATNIFITNRETIDSLDTYLGGPHTTTMNRPAGTTDLTYAASGIGMNFMFNEAFGDTLGPLHYGGPIEIVHRTVNDSVSSRFGVWPAKRYMSLPSKGVIVHPQFFPPKHKTSFLASIDGMNGAGFQCVMGIGATWGYNVDVFSSIPGMALSPFISGIDMQRDNSRARADTMTGNGVYNYIAHSRHWQQAITDANVEVGHYIEQMGDYLSIGSTDWNIGAATTKQKVLNVTKIKDYYSYRAMPIWRSTNEIYNGNAFVQEGVNDFNWFAGMTRIGGNKPDRTNGDSTMYALHVVPQSRFDSTMWFDGGYINSTPTLSFGNNGTMKMITRDSSQWTRVGSEFGNGAYTEWSGKYQSNSVRGGMDNLIHYTYNANAPFRVVWYSDAGAFERRVRLQRNTMFFWGTDSLSVQFPAYKFGGRPRVSSATWVVTRDSASEYESYARLDALVGASTNFANTDLTLTANRSHSTDGHSLTINNTQAGAFIVNQDYISRFASYGDFSKFSEDATHKDYWYAQHAEQGLARYGRMEARSRYVDIRAVAPGGTSFFRLDSTYGEINTPNFLFGNVGQFYVNNGSQNVISFNGSQVAMNDPTGMAGLAAQSNAALIGRAGTGGSGYYWTYGDSLVLNQTQGYYRFVNLPSGGADTTNIKPAGFDVNGKPYRMAYWPTAIGVGGGETNTASNLGGGLDNFSSKSGVDLRFNSFLASDFDLTSNVIGIDYANAQQATAGQNGILNSTDWFVFQNKQNNDADLDAIAALTPSNDDFLQRKAGAWANRTVAQVKVDLGVSGTNTGDQTITLSGAVTGSGTGAITATFATPGTLTVASSNSNANAHTHAITSSSAPGAAASILATDASGHIGSTGTRIVKGWFADITATNAISGSITGNAATVTTNANLTGDVTSSGNATTLATVNSNVGSFGSSTQVGAFTVNAKGLVTAASNTTVTPAVGSITGLGTGVGTWLATPSSANLRGAVSDENGTGAALFNGATTPDWTTGFTIGTAAASRKMVVGNGTNYVASTETWAVPGTSANMLISDGTNWTSAAYTGTSAIATVGTVTAGTINTRWKARVGSTTSSATPTINTDNVDKYKLTAQTANITSFTTNLTGTPNDGDVLVIEITGTASRTITWGASFVATTVALPTTTSGTATLTTVFEYKSTSSYGNNTWQCANSY